MKIHPALKGVLWFFFVMFFLGMMFALAFAISAWFFQRTGYTPAPLAVQLINSMGGIFLTGTMIALVSRVFQDKIRAGEMQMFGPIIQALDRIAKGDFSVRVDDVSEEQRGHGFIGKLVTSVNDMALELNEMENMRQEFISNVSHELQSPLTSIRGFAQALRNDELALKDRHHYLAIIETETTRLSRLTENLLRLASLEAKHVRFEPKPYALDKQIRNLILACEPQWTGKAIEIDAALDEVTITADEDLMSQVWINLIHNSIKFTPERGSINVKLHQQGDAVAFEIADTGVGITDEDRAHIFERFYKADKSRTRTDTGGSGLGLSIVQKIVEMHRGTVAVASTPGSGTSFFISLPAN